MVKGVTPVKGRPGPALKYCPEICERIDFHLRCGATEEMAAGSVGIARDTLRVWKLEYPEFQALVEKAKEAFKTDNLARLTKAAQGGSVQAATWLLERRGGPEFKEQPKQVQHEGGLDIHVVYDDREPTAG